MYEEYLIVDLPFEDDLNDKCGNSWKGNGPPIIKDTSSFTDINGNKLFNKACYFNGNSNLIIYNLELFKTNSLYISCYYYLTSYSPNGYIFSLRDMNNTSLFNGYCQSDTKQSEFQIWKIGSKSYSIPNSIIHYNTWEFLEVIYQKNQVQVFINKILQDEFEISIQNTTNKYKISIASNIGSDPKINFTMVGYIKNFKIYNNNAKVLQESVNLNSNTKRLFSFTYDYNTNRTTKWNQKVNYYVMDPNIYKKG